MSIRNLKELRTVWDSDRSGLLSGLGRRIGSDRGVRPASCCRFGSHKGPQMQHALPDRTSGGSIMMLIPTSSRLAALCLILSSMSGAVLGVRSLAPSESLSAQSPAAAGPPLGAALVSERGRKTAEQATVWRTTHWDVVSDFVIKLRWVCT